MSGEKDIKKAVDNAVEKAGSKKKSPRAGQSGKAQHNRKRSFPFVIRKGELCKQIEGDDGNKVWVPFGTELNVIALTRNQDGEEWGRLLEIVDRDGNRHEWAMPQHLLAGSGEGLRAELLGLGFELYPGRNTKNWLAEYILTADPEKRACSVSRIGWHKDAFVLPDGSIGAGQDDELIKLQSSERLDHAFETSGTLQDWQVHIASPARGNSRLILSICAGFAAPLLALTGDESGGIHFRGASSSGKSTALVIAGSVWGGGGVRGYIKQWRATDNALESIAAMHCDALACFDELSQIDPKSAGNAAYMLANGKGKARAGREGQARRVIEWRVIFLSNGEIGLADKIREGGQKMAAGMEVRVVDLRADAGAGMGLFENIHGAKDPATFAQNLKAASNKFYGTASRSFVTALVTDPSSARNKIADLRRNWMQNYLPAGCDGQVRRVADRFSLLAAAGEAAAFFGITGWNTGEASTAALQCFQSWLIERGGIGSGEVSDARRRLAEAIEVHGASRFSSWDVDHRRIIVTNRYGYVKGLPRSDEEQAHKVEYFFVRSALDEILQGLDYRSTMDGLMETGVIIPQGPKMDKPNKVYKVPSEGKSIRLFAVDLEVLHGVVDEVSG